ncbi:MAG TPA: phage tail sheath family protein [Arcobacter sp.]|nr:phage tail sheath family protein [Arcobacter sp.]
MALEYYTPGVYVEEVSSGFKPITGVPTSIVGFIGETQEGPLNKPTMIVSWGQYFDNFIGYRLVEKMSPRGTKVLDANGNAEMEHLPNDIITKLDWGIYAFFNNGGSKCYVVSVATPSVTSDPKELKKEIEKITQEFKEKKDPKKQNELKILETKLAKMSSSQSSNISKEIIGNDGGPNNRTGLHCFKDVTEIALLVAPGITEQAVLLEVLSYCETFNIFAILDAPQTLDELSNYGLATNFNGLSELGAKLVSKQAAVYFPWIKTYDKKTDSNISVAPSGFVAGIYGRVDTERGVHKAPANEVVRLAQDLEYNLSDVEQETLNQKGVNCIRNFSDIGIRVWGARTTITVADPEWKYINVRRLFNMVEKSLQDGSKWAVFEPNDVFLWKKLKRNVTAFLNRIHKSGALVGHSADQAFFVRCDESTNPQENIDAGIVVIEIGIAPVKPAEFIVFRISQKSPAMADDAA